MQRDANGMQVLSRAEAIALLETQEVGRLVYTRRALPAVAPVNYAVREDAIWIFTGSASTMGQAVRGAVVAFEVDQLDRATRSGWSVTVTAEARIALDEGTLARARRDGPVPWAPGVKQHLIVIPLTVVTGRRIPPQAGEQALAPASPTAAG
jgi:nitroimidazol reductase NimA-like FMN-containing flavoprotein (pyridoxamine 5'-phosphate oxidase superfamily)